VGPLVDSIHNQCLLEYDILPITVSQNALQLPSFLSSTNAPAAATTAAEPILCTSWLIPPLLGVAYVVLGGILPRITENVIVAPTRKAFNLPQQPLDNNAKPTSEQQQIRAYFAVVTTVLIIKLSELLQTQSLFLLPDGSYPEQSLSIMLFAALSQWLLLDGTPAALLAASITSIGGPLSELPFVALGAWHYIPSASDYLPLSSIAEGGLLDTVASRVLGDGYDRLALSSITGPCYFAVTMDSIALGRWFDAQDTDVET